MNIVEVGLTAGYFAGMLLYYNEDDIGRDNIQSVASAAGAAICAVTAGLFLLSTHREPERSR